jgi:hypothetical protein
VDRWAVLSWLIDRYDNSRSAIAARAAIVLSANALLLGASGFLASSLQSANLDTPHPAVAVRALLGAASIFFVASVILAALTLANVWRSSKRVAWGGRELGSALHAGDSARLTGDYDRFHKWIMNLADAELHEEATKEAWRCMRLHQARYRKLRWSLKVLMFGFAPFALAFVIAIRSGHV